MESAEHDALQAGQEHAEQATRSGQAVQTGREVVAEPSAPAGQEAAEEQVGQDDRALRFEDLGLSQTMLAAVQDLGYEEPTPVQVEAIPLVLEGRDLMAAAQTGTGKTAAFLLPIMDRLPHAEQVSARGRTAAQGPFLLVVTPTRELAQQIEEVCQIIARRTGHTSVTVVGGVSYNPQRDALKRGCDILIATPGRLLDLIDQEACSLDQVQVLVLDEADRMLDMGFLPSMRKIVGYTSDERQTLLFSATLDEKVVGGITDLVHDPARVEIAPVTEPTETVAQYVLPVSTEAKNGMLAQVLKREGARRVIVFTRTKRRADTCCKRLARAGFTCAAIHGNRSQSQRERALEQFRSGEVDVLVATDVLARGIDISDVSYVVNFDVPEEPVDYIHRIGRTGRAGETGWSLTFVTPEDVGAFYDIEALMGRTVETFDTRGLDTGENPPRMNPNRAPAKHVATKAEKKRRKQQNASRAQAANGAKKARNSAERTARTNEGSSDMGSSGRGGSSGGGAGRSSSGRGQGSNGGRSSGNRNSGQGRSSGQSQGAAQGRGSSRDRATGQSRSPSQGRSNNQGRSSSSQSRGSGSQGRSASQGKASGSQGRSGGGQSRSTSQGISSNQGHTGNHGQGSNGNRSGGAQQRDGGSQAGGRGNGGQGGSSSSRARGTGSKNRSDDGLNWNGGIQSQGAGRQDGDGSNLSAGQTRSNGQQTGRADPSGAKRQGGRASAQDNKRQGGRASGGSKKQAGSGTSPAGRSDSASSNNGRSGSGSGNGSSDGQGGGNSGRQGVGKQKGSSQGHSGGAGDAVAFEGSTRSASDVWRNYDEPSARDARLYNATTPNENRAESRTGRHPGDGGGEQ